MREQLAQVLSDRARAHSGRAVDLGEADPRGPRDLALAGLAAQLEHDLVHLAQPRGADRLAVGQAAAVGVDRQPPADARGAALDQRLLLAVLAQAGLGEVHDLGAGLGVLQLGDVDVLRADARLLERRRGRLGRRRDAVVAPGSTG